LQQPEHAAKPLELRGQMLLAAVDPVGELEQHGNGLRRAEVVVHRLLEAPRVRLAPVDLGFLVAAIFQRGVQPAERVLRVVEVGIGVVERAAVVRAQYEEAHDLRVVFLEDVAHGKEIAKRLRHLLLLDLDEGVVHPVIHEVPIARAFGLRDLVLVMRKLQVLAAAVEVEMAAEELGGHDRALDVPARPALPPG
jgi:hypothetical protein